MIVPSFPVTNFVVRQARFALRTLNALFDAVLGFGDSGKLGQLGVWSCIRQVIVSDLLISRKMCWDNIVFAACGDERVD